MLTISDHWINQTAIVRTLAGLFAAMVLAQTQECGLAFPNDSTAVTVKVSIPYKGRSFKVSNHVLLVFQRNWSNKGKNNVELFSRSGKRLGSLNSLAAVKDAKDMSIWDAAVGPQGQLALAVVSVDRRGRTSAHLLLYDSAGRLLHALSLPPDRMIRKLDVDEENKIWALGESSGDEDPASRLVVFKYSWGGKLAGQYLRQGDLPPIVDQGQRRGSGPDALGLNADGVWVWLPARRVLVTFRRDGTHIEIRNIGVPFWTPLFGPVDHPEVILLRFAGLARGAFVAEVEFRAPSSSHIGRYVWSKTTPRWNPLLPAQHAGNLVGAERDRMVLGHAKGNRPEIEFRWEDVPEF